MFFSFIITFSLLSCIRGAPNDYCLVHTKLGTIAGIEIENEDNTPVYRFLGIPYAKSPVGKLRFKDPERRTEPYKATLLARYRFKCMQYFNKNVQGQEDCLYLNIFTTSLDPNANHDVLVFIHGGGFYYGSNYAQSQEYLLAANKKIVFVAINYRLGPFGFLSTEDGVVPGNMGMKDQVLALEWIQENIKLFGGNPNKVTISGISAGGISVHLHYLSPMSKNLFAQGISMSGAALSPLIRIKGARKETEKLASRVKCPTYDSSKMMECLSKVDGTRLLMVMVTERMPWQEFNSYINFLPVIEKEGCNPFLDEHPYHILRKGKVKNAPWLVSVTTAEGLKPAGFFVEKENLLKTLNENWNDVTPYMLLFKEYTSKDQIPRVSQAIKEEYFKNQPVSRDNRNQLIKLIGDRLYVCNIENAVRLHAAASQAPVYFYVFNYRGKYSFSTYFSKTETNLGVSHIDDLIYLLKMYKFQPLEEDSAMVDKMVGIWSSFIKTGVPDAKNGASWPTVPRNIVYEGKLPYIQINNQTDLKVTSSTDLSHRNFWDSLPLQELHVSGDRIIPKFIQEQHSHSWIYNNFFEPVRKTFSRLIHPLFRLFTRNHSIPHSSKSSSPRTTSTTSSCPPPASSLPSPH